MKRSTSIAGVVSFAIGFAAILVQAEPTVTVELPVAEPQAVVFSPSGAQVAIGGLLPDPDGGGDGLVLLIDVESGERQAALRHSGRLTRDLQMPNPIRELAYSPDGKMLAVASKLGLKLWNPADREELATLLGYGIDDKQRQVEVTSIAFSPDGKLLAAAESRFEDPCRLQLWNVAQRELVGKFETGFRSGHVAFLPDGTLLVTADNDDADASYDLSDDSNLSVMRVKLGLFAVDRQGEFVAAVSEGSERMWRIEVSESGDWRLADEVRFTGQGPMSASSGVAFSPDGRLLATCGRGGALVIYDVQTRQMVGTLLAGGLFAFSPEGTSIAVAQGRLDRSPDGVLLGGTGVTHFAIWKTAEALDADRLAEQARTAARDMVRKLSGPQPDLWMLQAGSVTTDMLRSQLPPRPDMWMTQDGAVTVLAGPRGEAAVPILTDGLKNPQVHGKQRLLQPLGLIARRDAQARAAVIEALRTAEPADVRTTAATMLALLPADVAQEAVPALVEAAVNDESTHVRFAAERTLKELDPKAYEQAAEQVRARGPVVDRVERRDGKLVYQGRSLEEWLKRLSVSYMPNEIFGVPRPNEPLVAIRAIGSDAIPVLLDTLNSREQVMRQAAAAGLEALGPQAADAVDPLLEIIAMNKKGDLATGSSAADAIAAIVGSSKEPPTKLLALLQSDEPAVRLSAARAIARIQPHHTPALQTLKAAAETSLPDPFLHMHHVVPFTQPPSIEWLTKTVADPEAPRDMRMRAAATLSKLGEKALPAVPGILGVIGVDDVYLSRDVELAIQGAGPRAIPAVRDALKTASSDRTRKRLAAVLWGMGGEGRHALQELLTGDDAENLWWAASTSHLDQRTATAYQMAARESLQKLGQTVTPPNRPRFMPPKPVSSDGFGMFPDTRPAVKWLANTVADRAAPRLVRIRAANELAVRGANVEVLPMLPALLEAIGQEDDRGLSLQIEMLVRRLGPQAVPAVRDALLQAKSDETRRRLLSTLYGMGNEGRIAAQELVQNDSRLHQRLSTRSGPSRRSEAVTREIPPGERVAIAAAEQSARPLTNGDFHAGLDGWQVEGGGGSFRTFRAETGMALTTWGDRQDGNTGRLYQCFQVPDDALRLTFKLHGGGNIEKTYVALWHKVRLQQRLAARNSNTELVEGSWDLTPLRGEVLTLEIVDRNTAGWGFIGAQDFSIVRGKSSPSFNGATAAENGVEPAKRPATCLVTFHVHVPPSTPVDDVLYVAGNDPTLGNWSPQGLRLERKDSGAYESQVRLNQGSRVEYKITRGSWATVEKGKSKKELPNRVLDVSSDRTVKIFVAHWRDQLNGQQAVAESVGESQTAASNSASSAAAKPAETPRIRYDVPDGGVEELQRFVEELQRFRPSTIEESREHQRRSALALQVAAEKILELEQDESSDAYRAAKKLLLEVRIRNLRNADVDEKKSIVRDLTETLKSKSPSDLHHGDLSLAMTLARGLEYGGQPALAAEAYDSFGEVFSASENQQIASRAERFAGAARRLRLPGNPIELTGALFGGGELDWDSYRGKVVLVDFWATWCGPCVAELPNVRKYYELYHDRGFDVVGISLDRSREALEAFLAKNPLPWATLYDDEAKGAHPLATYYGIMGIPTVLLVDKKGQVVSLRARGEELGRLLEEQLGPATEDEVRAAEERIRGDLEKTSEQTNGEMTRPSRSHAVAPLEKQAPAPSPAHAGFVFTNCKSMAGLQRNGDAAPFGDRLRLTPAAFQRHGATWVATQQAVRNGFQTSFQFQITGTGGRFSDRGGDPGGDGLALVVE